MLTDVDALPPPLIRGPNERKTKSTKPHLFCTPFFRKWLFLWRARHLKR